MGVVRHASELLFVLVVSLSTVASQLHAIATNSVNEHATTDVVNTTHVTIPVTACDVRDYGAIPDGTTLNTRAINAAVHNASCASIIVTGGGVYVTGSIRLRSHMALVIADGTTLLGAPNNIGAYDPPEPNPWDAYQDFGHSHWHNALMWGVGVEDVVISGGGHVDGGGLASSNPPVGGGDKVFSFKQSRGITIANLTMGPRTGHFGILATDVTNLVLENLSIAPTRDCIDIVGCTDVSVRDVHCAGGGDDALVLKSDYSTGAALPVRNVTVRDSSFSTDGATAVEIGSETTGNFSRLWFDNITIRSAGDAGIGMAVMDGSVVRDVHYSNIVMTGVDSPFQFYIGARLLRPSPVGQPGVIRDVLVENVTATDMFNMYKGRNWTATIDGQPVDASHGVAIVHPVGPNITFSGLRLTFKGGGLPSDVTARCPHNATHWFMVNEVRPAYAFFVRNAVGVTLRDADIRFERPDGRPCVVLDATRNIALERFQCQRSTLVGGYDVGLRNNAIDPVVIRSPGIVSRRLAPTPPPPPVRGMPDTCSKCVSAVVSPSTPLPPKWNMSGVTFTGGRYCPSVAMGSNASKESLSHLASTGASWVSVVVTWYTWNISSTSVFPLFNATTVNDTTSHYYTFVTPSDADVVAAVRHAHALGLKVMLKPHVDLLRDNKPVGRFWRGDIGGCPASDWRPPPVGVTPFTESQWDAWFRSYAQFIMRYATTANALGVEMLSLNCELYCANRQAAQWRRLVPQVRSVYTGLLTVSQIDGHEDEISWWGAVDVIGIDAYYKIPGDTLDEMVSAWAGPISLAARLSARYNRPVAYTEIGYCSGKCSRNHTPTGADRSRQALHYQAVFEAFRGVQWFAGCFWWNWVTDPGDTAGDDCLTPQHKPAEDVLRRYYRAERPKPTPVGHGRCVGPGKCTC